MIFKLSILVVACCVCLVSCAATNKIAKQNNVLSSTVPSLMHGETQPPKKIDDKDYWDTDDFVPYKEDRHDTFDWKLFREILLSEKSNVVVSPFSIKLVLTLLSEAAGIDTKTQQELNSVFPQLKNKHLIQEIYRNYLKSLSQPSEHYTLNVGTKLFVGDYVNPRQRYAAIIKNAYNAEIEKLDFKNPDAAADIINGWVGNVTDGHIQDIVDSENVKNSILFIINAIFFEGHWRSPFDNQTFQSPFLKTTDNSVKTEYMSQQDYFYYFDSTKMNAKIIRLPYRGKKFSMTIVMPNAVGAINQLIQELEGDGLKRLQWLMDFVQVKLTVPKFKIDFTSQLKSILTNLGIEDIFTNDASLPGLARGVGLNEQLKVSNILQKAGLVVNEKGSTAYAATKVEIVNKFGGNSVEEFLVNRPFVFFIEDETTGNMLFFGKVVDPTI